MNSIPVEMLDEVFFIAAGTLHWKHDMGNKVRAGDVAGSRHHTGYIEVEFSGRRLLAHRIIFAMSHGRWPNGEVDHRNGDRFDNRPSNLREATRTENSRNRNKPANNTSGFSGVTYNKRCRKWQAQIGIPGATKYLGLFRSAEDANQAAIAARRSMFNNFAPEICR